jgi:hypothetical protein
MKTVLDLPDLNQFQNVEVMRLCLVGPMPLLPAGIQGAREIYRGSSDGLNVLGRE